MSVDVGFEKQIAILLLLLLVPSGHSWSAADECWPDCTKKPVVDTSGLVAAAAVKDADGVRDAIMRGVDVNGVVDEYSYTALHWAASNSDLDSLRMLIAAGADVDARDGFGIPALCAASENGALGVIEVLVREGGSDLSLRGGGWSPLMWAAAFRKPHAAKLLLKLGANVHQTSTNGQTALLLAASKRGNADVIKILVDAGARVTATDKFGMTALDWAIESKCRNNVEILESLVTKGSQQARDED